MENKKEDWINSIKNKEIKLNFKNVLLIIAFWTICIFLGNLQGHFWALKLNSFWNISLFVLLVAALIYNVKIKANKKTILLLLLATVVFFIDIFYQLFK